MLRLGFARFLNRRSINCVQGGFMRTSTQTATEISESRSPADILDEDQTPSDITSEIIHEAPSISSNRYQREFKINGVIQDLSFEEKNRSIESTWFVLQHWNSERQKQTFIVRSNSPGMIIFLYNKNANGKFATIQGNIATNKRGDIRLIPRHIELQER